jgi:hypothetical protein
MKESPMSDRKQNPGQREALPGEESQSEDHKKRRKAASSLLSPTVPPAAAGAMLEVDSRLDDRSETEEALKRAKGVPD